MGKIASLIISIAYLVIAYTIGGGEFLIMITIFLLLPMACIWFGEELGSYTGILFFDIPRRRTITSESPGWLVKLCGWILLLLPALIGVIIYTFSN